MGFRRGRGRLRFSAASVWAIQQQTEVGNRKIGTENDGIGQHRDDQDDDEDREHCFAFLKKCQGRGDRPCHEVMQHLARHPILRLERHMWQNRVAGAPAPSAPRHRPAHYARPVFRARWR